MGNKALSPFISTTLIIMLAIVAISLVLSLVNPSLDKARDSTIINEAFQNLNLIDDTIKEVVSEGEGARTTILLGVNEGKYEIDSNSECINFTYIMKTGLDISDQKNGINITRAGNTIYLFIIYERVDIQGSDHFTKGENSVVISHEGINPTTNYPMIYIGK